MAAWVWLANGVYWFGHENIHEICAIRERVCVKKGCQRTGLCKKDVLENGSEPGKSIPI